MEFKAYIATNVANGKKYVGITAQPVVNRKWAHLTQARTRKSDTFFHRAIRKYGEDKFVFEHVCSSKTKEDIIWTEKTLIVQHNSRAPFGYNLTEGGDGSWGFRFTSRQRNRLKLRPKRILSEDHKKKLSLANKGKHFHVTSLETRQKLAAANLGKKNRAKSEEAKQAISAKNKRRWGAYSEKEREAVRENIRRGRQKQIALRKEVA